MTLTFCPIYHRKEKKNRKTFPTPFLPLLAKIRGHATSKIPRPKDVLAALFELFSKIFGNLGTFVRTYQEKLADGNFFGSSQHNKNIFFHWQLAFDVKIHVFVVLSETRAISLTDPLYIFLRFMKPTLHLAGFLLLSRRGLC